VQQQQGGPYGSLSFSSQFGTFTVDSLPIVSPAPAPQQNFSPAPAPVAPQQNFNQQPLANNFAQGQSSAPGSQTEIFSSLERLAQLHQSGVLSEDEFRAKKGRASRATLSQATHGACPQCPRIRPGRGVAFRLYLSNWDVRVLRRAGLPREFGLEAPVPKRQVSSRPCRRECCARVRPFATRARSSRSSEVWDSASR
jgi:hypothetical protein